MKSISLDVESTTFVDHQLETWKGLVVTSRDPQLKLIFHAFNEDLLHIE